MQQKNKEGPRWREPSSFRLSHTALFLGAAASAVRAASSVATAACVGAT
jgi:hypothetical protein